VSLTLNPIGFVNSWIKTVVKSKFYIVIFVRHNLSGTR